jgi:Fic family protein
MAWSDNVVITAKMLGQIAAIDEFKGRWQALGQLAPDRLQALRRVATVESVGSSTRIEGAKLSDAEVERLLGGLQVHSFRSRDEQEVAGYAEVMELIFQSWDAIPLTENYIKQLHGMLLKHSDKDERHRGLYKTLPNHVEAFGPDGKSLGVIFQTASPFDTPRMMEQLLAVTSDALSYGKLHPLLVIAQFVVRFLAIHPFQDGNGRLSRILTTLMLLRAGYAYVAYSSLERVIEESKDAYYLALRRAQATLASDESGLPCWIDYFLDSLVQQKEALMRKVEVERFMMSLSPLSQQLLVIAKDHGRLTMADAEKLTGANRNTIKAHLRRLVLEGHLKMQGTGRGVSYSVA